MPLESEIKLLKGGILAFLGILTVACTVTPIENPVVDAGPAFDGVCFETEILPFFVSRCSSPGCHSAADKADDIDLSSFDGIRREVSPGDPNAGDLIESMRESDPEDIMPPPPAEPISEAQIGVIEQWILEGAKYSTNCNQTSCDLNRDISFASDVIPIIDLYCFGCHNTADPQGGYSYSTHAETMKSVDDGTLLGSIKFDQRFVAMPYKTRKMNDCNIDIIIEWVNQGALNN